jgi:hypothetical protein
MEWFLKHKLQQYFINAEDEFKITDGRDRTQACYSGETWNNSILWYNDFHWNLTGDYVIDIDGNYSCINNGKWYNERVWDNVLPWVDKYYSCINSGVWTDNKAWNNTLSWENEPEESTEDKELSFYTEDIEVSDEINVYAPAITKTVKYTNDDYERDIRSILSVYMINFDKINVIIANAT